MTKFHPVSHQRNVHVEIRILFSEQVKLIAEILTERERKYTSMLRMHET